MELLPNKNGLFLPSILCALLTERPGTSGLQCAAKSLALSLHKTGGHCQKVS